MKIYSIAYDNYQMLNSKTGEVIVGEEYIEYNAKSLIGYWFEDFVLLNHENLKKAWKHYERNNKGTSNIYLKWDALIKFIEQYESQEWISYEITSSGIACGNISYTAIFIVDKDVIIERLDED